MTIAVRAAAPADRAAIAAINTEAFGQPDEAALVEALRADGDVAFELAAERDGAVVGHILFSPLALRPEPENAPRLLSLAPVAVRPDCQRQGVGGALVRAGLGRARTEGWDAVIVLGHPDYYPPFGFSHAAAAGLDHPFPEAGPAFMALELSDGALARAAGRLVFAPAFGIAGDAS